LSNILIKNGRLIDPKTKFDETVDIFVSGEKIAKIGKNLGVADARVINAAGLIVAPGLIDLHCHLRDPGRPDEETIETGGRAAIAGGFTSVCCMPNTEPAIDNEGIVNYILREAARSAQCRVFPIAAITKQRQGKEITEFGSLIRAGARGFSDDGDTVADAGVLRHALEYSKIFGVSVFEHALDKNLTHNGQMNESLVSTRLGLAGSPTVAEEIIVARDLLLARYTGARLHLCHISTRGAVDLIRRAKQEGVDVTSETCPHYFTLNDEILGSYDPRFKVNPPIRTEADRRAVIEGLRDGTIDCIATDHAPHSMAEKELEFGNAPFGMTGLETALALSAMELVNKEKFSWMDVLAKMTQNPARVIRENLGVVKPAAVADLVLIDPEKKWRLTPERIKSRSKNTPWLNRDLTGCVHATIVAGDIKYTLE